jgi:hypothetical protein
MLAITISPFENYFQFYGADEKSTIVCPETVRELSDSTTRRFLKWIGNAATGMSMSKTGVIKSKFAEWSRIPFAPLLAKCVLVVSLFFPIVFGVLYPDRKEEADAYANAPACAPNVVNSSNCRLIADAEFIDADCQNNTLPDPDDFCEAQFAVIGLKRFIGLDRQRVESLAPGTHVRLELFQTGPTRAEFDGQFVVQRGSPKEAVEKLKEALVISIGMAIVAAIYLYHWKRRKPTT